MRLPAAAAAVACLLLACGAGAASRVQRLHVRRQERPQKTSITTLQREPGDAGARAGGGVFVIESEADARRAAAAHAGGPAGVLRFSTLSFTHRGKYAWGLDAARHLWANLRQLRLQSGTLLLSYDAHSCQVLVDSGIPCFLDRWLPQPATLAGQYRSDVPHWHQKYAWALKLLEFGHTILFLEMDMVLFSDPQPHFDRRYDLQGLSDWLVPDLGRPEERFLKTCATYHLQKGGPNGDGLAWGPYQPGDPNSLYSVNPCVSTGFWFAQPTAAAKAFIGAYLQLQQGARAWQNDQQLWNEAVMAFLYGHGEQPPLRLGLLNTTHFSNIGMWEERRKRRLPTDPVMLHCGFMHGWQKQQELRKQGWWRGDSWTAASAEGDLGRLEASYGPRRQP